MTIVEFKGKKYQCYDFKRCKGCLNELSIHLFRPMKIGVKMPLYFNPRCRECEKIEYKRFCSVEAEYKGEKMSVHRKKYRLYNQRIKNYVKERNRKKTTCLDDEYIKQKLANQLKVSFIGVPNDKNLFEMKRTQILTSRLIKKLNQSK